MAVLENLSKLRHESQPVRLLVLRHVSLFICEDQHLYILSAVIESLGTKLMQGFRVESEDDCHNFLMELDPSI
jgi:hypothetical protein